MPLFVVHGDLGVFSGVASHAVRICNRRLIVDASDVFLRIITAERDGYDAICMESPFDE
ncbi:MAG: hypothetical protein AAF802_03605 [Planctomycetota bacterium]